MSHHIPIKERVLVLDKFSQKMANSDHSLEVVRRSMVSGLKGYLRKVARCEKEGKPFHRTAAASSRTRKLKKLTAKQSWFKTKPKSDGIDSDTNEERVKSGTKLDKGSRGWCKGEERDGHTAR